MPIRSVPTAPNAASATGLPARHRWLLALACFLPLAVAGPAQAETLDEHYQILAGGAEVKDLKTGLIWQRCSVGQRWNGKTCTGEPKEFTFEKAQRQAGKGWRVPTVRELQSLRVCSTGFVEGKVDLGDGKAPVSQQCAGDSQEPTIHKGAFPQTSERTYWTSSPYADYPSNAWYVRFLDGYLYDNVRYDDSYVRLVR